VRGRRTEIGQHPIRIRFVDDAGAELMGGDGTVQFGEPPAGVTEIEAGAVLVFDVPLPRPGTYAFEISMDSSPAIRVPLSASQLLQGRRRNAALGLLAIGYWSRSRRIRPASIRWIRPTRLCSSMLASPFKYP
jgi:hypothetical protein